jgi:hypothetical protein
MSAKEKAIELVDRYSELGIGHPTSLLLAKQCALIAVNEILNEPDCSEVFWQEVKQEIINL